MRLRRLVAVALLVSLLSASVGATNAVVAAERTVLSGEFVKESLAEADAYGTVRTTVIEQATAGAGGAGNGSDSEGTGREGDGTGTEDGGGPPGVFGDATARIVEEAVTEAYLQRQVERNVDRTYAYLHGDREELVLAVDLEPVQDQMMGILEEEIRNASLAELFGALGPGGTAIPVAGTSVNLTVVGEMAESPEAYEATRAEFRSDVRESIVAETVNRTYDSASNDERLALVVPDYDPDEYSEAEKGELVAEREGEIRDEMRRQVEAERGDEVDAAVDEQLEALAAVDADELATGINSTGDRDGPGDGNSSGGGLPPGVVTPLADVAATGVEALATDMPYETFVAETDDAKARLAANVTATIEGQIDAEGTDEMVVLDTREPGTSEGFEQVRTAVGIVDLLSVLLPLVAVGLVGLLWWLTRSPAVVAGGTGVALLVGGLPGYLLANLAGDLLAETLAGGEVPPVASGLLLGTVDRVLAVVAAQSLALAVAGVALIAVAGYLHRFGTPAWAQRT